MKSFLIESWVCRRALGEGVGPEEEGGEGVGGRKGKLGLKRGLWWGKRGGGEGSVIRSADQ